MGRRASRMPTGCQKVYTFVKPTTDNVRDAALQIQIARGVLLQGADQDHAKRALLRMSALARAIPSRTGYRSNQVTMPAMHRVLVRVLRW